MIDSLSLVRCGDSVPTCGPGRVHDPLIWDFAGQPVRVIVRPNQSTEKVVCFVQTDVGTALGAKDPKHAARSINLVEGEDQGVESLSTPGGPQKIKVLTFKGLTKFLMRSNHAKAIEFQDLLASKASDLAHHGIAFANGPVTSPANAESMALLAVVSKMVETVNLTISAMADRIHALESRDPILARTCQYKDKKSGKWTDIQAWTLGTDATMQREQGLLTSKAWMLQHGASVKAGMHTNASGLTRRTEAFCIAFGHDYKVRARGLTVKIYYLPKEYLRYVYESGWVTGGVQAPEPSLFDNVLPFKPLTTNGGA